MTELSVWLKKQKDSGPNAALGIRKKCKITKIQGFQYHGPRFQTYIGIPVYFNF